jgi:hypothetical protein
MKKILALILALVMLLSLTGCAEIPEIVPSTVPGQLETTAPTGSTENTTQPTKPTETEPTVPTTQAPTQPSTEEPTQPPTQPPTEKPTEPPTQPPTEKPTEPPTQPPTEAPTEPAIAEDGWYYSKEDVSLYLHTYGRLPSNFLTKDQARALGWKSGSVERYKAGAAIGGDRFGNREGLLPNAAGRQYYECDIDTNGQSSRGAKRIVFSNDGLIYYTDDHYRSFTLLYGEA